MGAGASSRQLVGTAALVCQSALGFALLVTSAQLQGLRNPFSGFSAKPAAAPRLHRHGRGAVGSSLQGRRLSCAAAASREALDGAWCRCPGSVARVWVPCCSSPWSKRGGGSWRWQFSRFPNCALRVLRAAAGMARGFASPLALYSASELLCSPSVVKTANTGVTQRINGNDRRAALMDSQDFPPTPSSPTGLEEMMSERATANKHVYWPWA